MVGPHATSSAADVLAVLPVSSGYIHAEGSSLQMLTPARMHCICRSALSVRSCTVNLHRGSLARNLICIPAVKITSCSGTRKFGSSSRNPVKGNRHGFCLTEVWLDSLKSRRYGRSLKRERHVLALPSVLCVQQNTSSSKGRIASPRRKRHTLACTALQVARTACRLGGLQLPPVENCLHS